MQKRGCLKTRQPAQMTRHTRWRWIEMPMVRTLTLMSACCQAQLKLQSQDAAHIKPFTSRKEPRPSLTAVKGQHRPARLCRPPAFRITRREWNATVVQNAQKDNTEVSIMMEWHTAAQARGIMLGAISTRSQPISAWIKPSTSQELNRTAGNRSKGWACR